jgi:lysozyme family protein
MPEGDRNTVRQAWWQLTNPSATGGHIANSVSVETQQANEIQRLRRLTRDMTQQHADEIQRRNVFSQQQADEIQQLSVPKGEGATFQPRTTAADTTSKDSGNHDSGTMQVNRSQQPPMHKGASVSHSAVPTMRATAFDAVTKRLENAHTVDELQGAINAADALSRKEDRNLKRVKSCYTSYKHAKKRLADAKKQRIRQAERAATEASAMAAEAATIAHEVSVVVSMQSTTDAPETLETLHLEGTSTSGLVEVAKQKDELSQPVLVPKTRREANVEQADYKQQSNIDEHFRPVQQSSVDDHFRPVQQSNSDTRQSTSPEVGSESEDDEHAEERAELQVPDARRQQREFNEAATDTEGKKVNDQVEYVEQHLAVWSVSQCLTDQQTTLVSSRASKDRVRMFLVIADHCKERALMLLQENCMSWLDVQSHTARVKNDKKGNMVDCQSENEIESGEAMAGLAIVPFVMNVGGDEDHTDEQQDEMTLALAAASSAKLRKKSVVFLQSQYPHVKFEDRDFEQLLELCDRNPETVMTWLTTLNNTFDSRKVKKWRDKTNQKHLHVVAMKSMQNYRGSIVTKSSGELLDLMQLKPKAYKVTLSIYIGLGLGL